MFKSQRSAYKLQTESYKFNIKKSDKFKLIQLTT